RITTPIGLPSTRISSGSSAATESEAPDRPVPWRSTRPPRRGRGSMRPRAARAAAAEPTAFSVAPLESRPSMPTVTFVHESQSFEVEDGANLRKAAIDHGINLYRGPARLLNCRGRGKCKTCRVKVEPESNASPRTPAELPRTQGTIWQMIDHRGVS